MVIKIFYVVIAIFSVAMVFLASSDPYFSEQFKQDLSISNMQIKNLVDYEINSSKISAKYETDELNRYQKRDEFLNFKSNILRDNLTHNISSKKAIYKDDEITLIDNVKYENNESFEFRSDRVTYNQKTKVAISHNDFTMTRNGDEIKGESLIYDLDKKLTEAKGVKAWIEQKK